MRLWLQLPEFVIPYQTFFVGLLIFHRLCVTWFLLKVLTLSHLVHVCICADLQLDEVGFKLRAKKAMYVTVAFVAQAQYWLGGWQLTNGSKDLEQEVL